MGRVRPRFKSHPQRSTQVSAGELHAAALREFVSKRYAAAEDRCRQALTLDPKYADALHLLGLIHWQTERPAAALDLIAAAIRCNADNHEYFLNLGELLRELNKAEEARKSFDIAIRLAPERAVPWMKLGNLLRMQRQYDEALLSYAHAFTLEPGNAEAPALSAGALLELGRYQEALASCDRSLAISPDQVEALCVKGDCLRNLGRPAEAAASYRRASELEPDRVPVWRLLGTVLEQTGDRDGAVKALRRARELDPSDRFGAGVELMRLGADEVGEMPSAYVRLLFDQYAPTFDSALVQNLGYRGPALLADAVRAACAAQGRPAGFAHAIDLGCGTGLAAAAFAGIAERFTGVDLSPAMIEKARATGLYARLEVADMVEALRATPDCGADLVLSADAMVYVADLLPVLKQARRALSTGGVLAFTVETHDGDGFVMGEGRRYAHSAAYARACLEAAGLALLQFEQQSIRHERGVPVPGLVVVAVRSEGAPVGAS